MEFPDCRILVFGKAPVPGQCKTRIGKRLGMRRAAAIHQALLERSLNTAVQARLAPVELHYAPALRHPYFAHLQRQYGLSLEPQQGSDLGQRMRHAFSRSLGEARAVVLIGSDCAALTAEQLRRALETLYSQQSDAIFLPTVDGGYALVGMNRYLPVLFSNIRWGGSQVMQQTRRQLRRSRCAWSELECVWDVDETGDYLKARRAGFI